MKSLDTCATVRAPRKPKISAARQVGSTERQIIGTCREYWIVADRVPQMLADLLVPSSVAGATSGIRMNSAGTWIRPPPPATESMKPARNANAQSAARVAGSGKGYVGKGSPTYSSLLTAPGSLYCLPAKIRVSSLVIH